MKRGDGADRNAIDCDRRARLDLFRLNRDAIESDRSAESHLFVFPDKVNEFVGRDNCCASLCRDL